MGDMTTDNTQHEAIQQALEEMSKLFSSVEDTQRTQRKIDDIRNLAIAALSNPVEPVASRQPVRSQIHSVHQSLLATKYAVQGYMKEALPAQDKIEKHNMMTIKKIIDDRNEYFQMICKVEALLAEKEIECDDKQAKIDRLMMEYCPDEMTHEQLAEYAKYQKPYVVPPQHIQQEQVASQVAPVAPKEGRKIRELKVWDEIYKDLHSGAKTFDLRIDDRGYRAGDVLWLREYDHKTEEYNRREMRRLVTYIISGNCGLQPNVVCMSLASQAAPAKQEVVAWVRFCTDGGIEGPIMDNDKRMDGRRESGAWTPLGRIDTPAVAQEQAGLGSALSIMQGMTGDQRMDVMLNFCRHCGGNNPKCQCWNDE